MLCQLLAAHLNDHDARVVETYVDSSRVTHGFACDNGTFTALPVLL
jgi:hypothetical protein